MTTDIDIIGEIFTRAGIIFTRDDTSQQYNCIFIEQGKGPKNLGYTGFCSELHFQKDGSLVSMGTWEN